MRGIKDPISLWTYFAKDLYTVAEFLYRRIGVFSLSLSVLNSSEIIGAGALGLAGDESHLCLRALIRLEYNILSICKV